MGKEEQIEEREVLDSIFPEEIQGVFGFPCHGNFSSLGDEELDKENKSLTTQQISRRLSIGYQFS
jgi:hypothetical protein